MALSAMTNVSETARWVATYRAWETARADALFRDPYAARLAGARGEELARAVGRFAGARNGWPIVARTKLIDDMVRDSVADGCTTVLNLAAGFDTRPYRLALPPELRWIEADLPELIDEKEGALAHERPRCRLERVRIDLADPARRAGLFRDVAATSPRTMVITEGLVLYLDEPVVAQLGRDLAAQPSFVYWALDFPSPAILRDMQRSRGMQFQNAPMKFGPANGLGFFETIGWHARDVYSLFHEAARLQRLPWPLRLLALLPPPDARAPGKERWSGVVRLVPGAVTTDGRRR